MGNRSNRKSSDHYTKRAVYDGKSKRRGYKSRWNGTDGQPRRHARIGADATTGCRPVLRSLGHQPATENRCVVCRDPGGDRATSSAPRMHRGCARRLHRRGMRADLNRAQLQATLRAKEVNALHAPATPGAAWTPADVADLARKIEASAPPPVSSC